MSNAEFSRGPRHKKRVNKSSDRLEELNGADTKTIKTSNGETVKLEIYRIGGEKVKLEFYDGTPLGTFGKRDIIDWKGSAGSLLVRFVAEESNHGFKITSTSKK